MIISLILPNHAFALDYDIEQSEDSLRESQTERENTENELYSTTSTRDDVLRSIEEIVVEKQETQKRIGETTRLIEEKEIHLRDVTQKLSVIEKEVKEQQEQFGNRLSSMYLNYTLTDKIASLLRSENLSDFVLKLQYFKTIAEKDEEMLEELTIHQEEANNLRKEQESQLESLKDLEESLAEDIARLEADEVELEARAEELAMAMDKYQREIDEFEAAEADIIARIQALEAERSRAYQEPTYEEPTYEETTYEEPSYQEESSTKSSDSSEEVYEETTSNDSYTEETYEESSQESVSRGTGTNYSSGYAWPVPGYNYINSPFGGRWHPVLGSWHDHNGVDIPAPGGTPIVASRGGTVIMAEYYSSFGNTVIIDHGDGMWTLYAHGSSFNTYYGATVNQGDTIMYVGTTGRSTGNHLHFSVLKNGWNFVNPQNYI